MKTVARKSTQFPVVVSADSTGYWVSCPVIPGCYSQGETIDEALKNIQEAIELCLEEFPKVERNKIQQKVFSLHFVAV